MWLTGPQLHVHQGVGDDGQQSVAERVSAALPMNSLEETAPSLAPVPDLRRLLSLT